MLDFQRYLAVVIFSAAFLFTNVAKALVIQKFDKMALADQSEYAGLLVQGAERVLKDVGKADLAARVDSLSTTTLPGDAHTMGMVEFERNLALTRAADADRAPKDPKSIRLEVEHAMIVTLKKEQH